MIHIFVLHHVAGIAFFGTLTNWVFDFITRFNSFYVAGLAFFTSATGVLQKLVVGLGAGLGIWGVINLMEGYGNDNPGANAHVR